MCSVSVGTSDETTTPPKPLHSRHSRSQHTAALPEHCTRPGKDKEGNTGKVGCIQTALVALGGSARVCAVCAKAPAHQNQAD